MGSRRNDALREAAEATREKGEAKRDGWASAADVATGLLGGGAAQGLFNFGRAVQRFLEAKERLNNAEKMVQLLDQKAAARRRRQTTAGVIAASTIAVGAALAKVLSQRSSPGFTGAYVTVLRRLGLAMAATGGALRQSCPTILGLWSARRSGESSRDARRPAG